MNHSVTTVISKFFSTLWLADRWKSEQNVSEKLKTDFEKNSVCPSEKRRGQGIYVHGVFKDM